MVLSATEIDADDLTSDGPVVAKGTKVIRVERLRTADASPMAYEIGFYPAKLFPGLLGRELGTLYDVFASEYDVVVTSGEQTVRADNADGHVARILGVARRRRC